MQTNAIQRTVEQFANVQLLPKAPKRAPRKSPVSNRAFELGPAIVKMEARGLSHGEIATEMSMARSSVSTYAGQYRRAVRDGLV